MKSFLIPDKKKDSKRKTEEINITKLATGSKQRTSEDGFAPEAIRFNKPLEYKHVTSEMVSSSKLVLIEVAVKQKYTHRSYVIATWTEPLVIAIRMLVKRKYPLTPRIGSNIPDNMKVYSATNRALRSPHNIAACSAYSSPNSRATSHSSLQGPTLRTNSENNLHSVKVEAVKASSPNISIPMPAETSPDELLSVSVEESVYVHDVAIDLSYDAANTECNRTERRMSKHVIDMSLSEDVGKINKHVERRKSKDIIHAMTARRRSKEVIDMSALGKHKRSGSKKNKGSLSDYSSLDDFNDLSDDDSVADLVPLSFEHDDAMISPRQRKCTAISDIV